MSRAVIHRAQRWLCALLWLGLLGLYAAAALLALAGEGLKAVRLRSRQAVKAGLSRGDDDV